MMTKMNMIKNETKNKTNSTQNLVSFRFKSQKIEWTPSLSFATVGSPCPLWTILLHKTEILQHFQGFVITETPNWDTGLKINSTDTQQSTG